MNDGSRLMLRFAGMYGLALGLGTLLITADNRFMHQISWSELMSYSIPTVVAGSVLIGTALQIYTYVSLRPALHWLSGKRTQESVRKQAFERMTRLPARLFWGMVGFTVVCSLAYHEIEFRLYGDTLLNPDSWSITGDIVIFEFLLGLTLAAMLLGFSRSALRPFLLQLGRSSLEDARKASGLGSLAVTFVGCFLVAFLEALRWAITPQFWTDPARSVGGILSIAAYTAIAVAVLALHATQIRSDLRVTIGGIRELSARERPGMYRKIALISKDEIGRLAAAFNRVQGLIASRYEQLDRQLRLAYHVQQDLLPKRLPQLPYTELAGVCVQSEEVGGDFYEALRRNDNSLVLAVGDVAGKGMSAALVMSAVMALLRAEASRGGTAGEMLTRLNASLGHTISGNTYVTLGLAVYDIPSGRITYASAGHLAPMIGTKFGIEQPVLMSYPLGIDPEAVYEQTEFRLDTGDWLLMYSDGIVEARDERGEMLGFEEWEKRLREESWAEGAEAALARLLRGLPGRDASLPDDRTVVMLRRTDAAAEV